MRKAGSGVFTGTFSGTLTGMTGTVLGNVYYHVANGVCTLTVLLSISGTSNATTMTMTGLQSICVPATSVPIVGCANLISNGASVQGAAQVTTGGTITFFTLQDTGAATNVQNISTGFASSGSKGISPGWSITYPLN